MPETETETILKTLAEIQEFVGERFNPMEETVNLDHAEMEKLRESITEVQDGLKDQRRQAVLRAGDQHPRIEVPEGPYAGMDPVDMLLLEGFARSQARESWGPGMMRNVQEAKTGMATMLAYESLHGASERAEAKAKATVTLKDQYGRIHDGQFRDVFEAPLREFHATAMMQRAAMDSTTAGTGDELVATLQARELWMDVNLQTIVAPTIPTVTMPSNPFDMGRQLGDVNWYPGTENVSSLGTAPGTGRTTIEAYELVGQVPYSFTLEEDAIIAMLPEIRAGIVRNAAEIIDDLLLNADTTALNNINADGTTITKSDAGKGHWLIGYDGLIHLPLLDNTSQANDHNAAVSDDMFNEIRAKLGKYGVRPSELVRVMDVNTFIRAQSIANFRTMDKLGPNATLLTGMLGAVEGIPTIVSEQMLLTASDGKVTDGTAGTVGRLLIYNRNQWRQGFRREFTVDVDRDTQKRQTVVTASFRHGLVERSGTRSSATHTGLQYNITGV